MKKRLMSILISAIMILTSIVPITASAEETVNIFETYTFEEFLALSEEEICNISPYIRLTYEETKEESDFIIQTNQSYCRFSIIVSPETCDRFILEWNDNWIDCTTDYNALLATLKLPEKFFPGYLDIVPIDSVVTIFDENGDSNTYYTGYKLYVDKGSFDMYALEESEIAAKIHVWLLLNPIIITADHYELNAEETVNIFETYTFEEFLALSEEEIAKISEETAAQYDSYMQSYCSNFFMSGQSDTFVAEVDITFTDEYKNNLTESTGSYELTAEQLFSEISLPDSIFKGAYSVFSGTTTIKLDVDEYIGYTPADVCASACTWLFLNPDIEMASVCMLAGSADAIPAIGDVNQNSTIDTSDATNILGIYANYAAGISVADYTTAQIIIADIDKNGTVDITDATAILTYYAQKAAGLEPTWEAVLAP